MQEMGNPKVVGSLSVSGVLNTGLLRQIEFDHLDVFEVSGDGITMTISTHQKCFFFPYQPIQVNGNSFNPLFNCIVGTYRFVVWGVLLNNCSIVDWFIDDDKIVNQQDLYLVGSSTFNNCVAVPGLTLPVGDHTLRGVVNGKHASISNPNIVLARYLLQKID